MELPFGPNCCKDVNHEETRFDVLLDPPRGSPIYAMNATFDDMPLDRSPTGAEQRKTKEVKEMQEAIPRHVGAGRQPGSQDMVAILTAFGPNCTEKLPIYTLAVNTMDQGVRV